ncbi:lytic murein transglycosylase B [Marinobacter zhejiangensis]|uniref:Membrane-bound lytic murein transglycosylase B n=1 Tax=Marinobacter zhejiangensis TaxID=488535 RepID=A0A1I4TE12_9GAMM|nr:lytic murein transglycosylase B [Marinobacter zhejiangensis]SFM74905.1 membrane-bound lytic murein transglycosylase B [Marinobacter zhejiangensis]
MVLLALLWGVALDGVAGYGQQPDGQRFIAEMAGQYGFEPERIQGWLDQAERNERILESIARPAEKSLEWHEYRGIFMRSERISQGHEFLAEHRDAFARAEVEFGVPAEVIAAIIGVETWYGRYRGNYRVIDALSTLAFDYPPRSRFFRSELAQFFLMAREQGFDPLELQGSYAGAMGYGQFIASSYRHYAIDFDGDGVADILNNPVDAIGSVANYFHAHRWLPGQPVAERVQQDLPEDSPLLTRELKPRLAITDYLDAGLRLGAGLPTDAPARAIRLNGDNGAELWMTYHNFYVITRYNHSHLYAMAVKELSDALATQGMEQEAGSS